MMLYSQIITYSFLRKIFSKVTFFANEMGILGVDLDKLTLMMITIFMKIILKLFFMSDVWFAIINLKVAKY